MNGLLNYSEAAARLGLRLPTLYALVAQRRVPHVRMGRRLIRFDPAELDAWVDRSRVDARPSGPNVSKAATTAGLRQMKAAKPHRA